MNDVTQILNAIEQGDSSAAEQLLPLVYDELRKLAAQRVAQETPGQTLQATGLVHEAYLRLVDGDKAQYWNSRGHFFGAAAEAMRRILVENARRKGRLRHGGAHQRLQLDAAEIADSPLDDEIVALDEAIDRLAVFDPNGAQIVSLRYFAGLSNAEVATALNISTRTVLRRWAFAKSWLYRELNDPAAPFDASSVDS